MFSVEHEFDNTTITVLDDSGEQEDVAVILFDDVVYIRQYVEDTELASVVTMTPKMFAEMIEAYNRGEGSFIAR
jgi:ABC-type sugar transport system substrate-binding protein